MIGHLLVVAHLLSEHRRGGIDSTNACSADHSSIYTVSHIFGEISAVGSGIGAELLFVQALNIVQSLLCRITQDTVGIALQRSQIIERRSFLAFLLVADIFDHGGSGGSTKHLICIRLVLELLAGSGERTEVQFDGIKGFGLERGNICLALNQ